MKTETKPLHLDDATARRIYPGAAKELKEILEQNWPKGFFSLSLKDRIKTWEDCAAEYGKDPVRWLPYPRPQGGDEISCNGYFKLTKIIKLFREGVILDYNNPNQLKYWAWFYWQNNASKKAAGFAFSATVTDYDRSATDVGPRLSSAERGIAEHIARQFENIFNEFYNTDPE